MMFLSNVASFGTLVYIARREIKLAAESKMNDGGGEKYVQI
jgi:hypothetical protein